MSALSLSLYNEPPSNEFIKQPKNLDIELLPYQKHAIYLLEEFERTKERVYNYNIVKSNIILYSDKIGSGKTLTLVGLILRNKLTLNLIDPSPEVEVDDNEDNEDEDDNNDYKKYKCIKPYYVNYTHYNANDSICVIKTHSAHYYYIYNLTLILVNSSLVSQWELELDHTDLNYYTISRRSHLKDITENKVNIRKDYDVVLCSSTMFKEYATLLNSSYWKRFIIDEADSLKIPNMPKVNSDSTILVTATPSFLVSNYYRGGWIQQLFYSRYGNHHIDYNNIMIKNDDNYIDSIKSLSDPDIIIHECLSTVMTTLMDGIVKQSVMELINCGDISGAIKELGGTDSNENIMDLVTKNIKEQIEDATTELNKHKSRDHMKSQIKYWETKLEEYNNKLKILEDRFQNILDDDCAICMATKDKPVMISCCQNIACGKCILSWITDHDTCPFCRKDKKESKLIHIKNDCGSKEEEGGGGCGEDDKEEEIKKKQKIVTKVETIINIIKNKKDAKFLLFSMSDYSFQNIQNEMKTQKIKFKIYMGSKATRDKRIREFTSGEISVLCINSRINGSGLNLQMATDIILYHKMVSEIESQCIGRGQRMGRTTKLTVHKFSND